MVIEFSSRADFLSTSIQFLECISNSILDHEHRSRNKFAYVNLHIVFRCNARNGDRERNRIFWKPSDNKFFKEATEEENGSSSSYENLDSSHRTCTCGRESTCFAFRPIEFRATCALVSHAAFAKFNLPTRETTSVPASPHFVVFSFFLLFSIQRNLSYTGYACEDCFVRVHARASTRGICRWNNVCSEIHRSMVKWSWKYITRVWRGKWNNMERDVSWSK